MRRLIKHLFGTHYGVMTTVQSPALREIGTKADNTSSMFALSVIPAAFLLAGSTISYCEQKQIPTASIATETTIAHGNNLDVFSLSTKQRLFFKYEKRIRELSSLEKVFNYFSSGAEADGSKYMLPPDLLRAMRPTYPPSGSESERGGSLDGERGTGRNEQIGDDSIFKLFDIDADGKLSFSEFLLVLALLTIPESNLKSVFVAVDIDGSGMIDANEFKTILASIQQNVDVKGPSPKKDSSSGLLQAFFGPDQKGSLSLPKFMDFIRTMNQEMEKLEFEHYDCKKIGKITGLDFARSIVAPASTRKIDALLDKVDAMPLELQAAQVDRQEFRDYHKVLWNVHTLVVALDFFHQVGGKVDMLYFSNLVKRILGVNLSPTVLDIIFYTYGNNGELDVSLFKSVLERYHTLPGKNVLTDCSHDSDSFVGVVVKMFNCVSKCTQDQ